jgi:membrane fusion protein, multidrug efflux system
VNHATTQLSYTNITAPITGRVGHRTIEVGQQIERGQALLSIVSDEKWVVANFKETQLGRMRPGQAVDIKIDAYPQARVTGRIESISPASGAQFAMLPPDNATGNFTKVVQRVPVKIVLNKDTLKGYENLLAPGMSVVPSVHVSD